MIQETDEHCLILSIANNQHSNSQGHLLEKCVKMAKEDAGLNTLIEKSVLSKNVWNHEEKCKENLESLFKQII